MGKDVKGVAKQAGLDEKKAPNHTLRKHNTKNPREDEESTQTVNS